MMDARTAAIARTLQNNPHAQPMLEVMARKGKASGMGYVVEHVQPGRGFSSVEYSSKNLPNGQVVLLRTYYPGPFDGLAGYSTEITETYSVFSCWEDYDESSDAEYEAPPPQVALPAGATGWGCRAWDGPRNWFAEFDDVELAEAFANSLPPYNEGDHIEPLKRN